QHFSQLWPRLRALAEARPLCIVVIGGDVLAVELAFALERALGRDSRISLVSGSGGLLPGFADSAQRRVRDKLRQRRITLFDEDCVRIEAQQILLASGLKLACDAPVIAAGAGAPAWLRDSGLALAADGQVDVNELLQSRSHPEVFAALGGLAGREAAGAGEGLAINLRRHIAGGVLQPQRTGASTVRWLSFSDGKALALRGRHSATARWASWWKDYADRRYMAAWRVKAAGLPKKLPAVDKSEER
ncbi:MAG TPA: FAD-dependent oxidoreductase, partial [Methylibium sp.]